VVDGVRLWLLPFRGTPVGLLLLLLLLALLSFLTSAAQEAHV
jgi:hypothetical protein